MSTNANVVVRGAYAQRTSEEQAEIFRAAKALCEKLSDLTWQDRHIGFDQWSDLIKALNTGSLPVEK